MTQRTAIPLAAMAICLCHAQERTPANPLALQLKIVTGAPFTAQAVTESTRELPDGNRIITKKTASLARDSDGRTRREQGPLVIVHDPIAGTAYLLDPRSHSAGKIALPQTEVPGHARSIPDSKAESLGTQIIEGMEALGTRMTRTIAAGQAGNERPIEIVSEAWYSPELQTILMSATQDPRSGETTYKLTEIKRTEPDHSLFEIPADYVIHEESKASGVQGLENWRRNNR